MVELQELADALNAGGIAAEVLNAHNGHAEVLEAYRASDEYLFYWTGQGEDPALCFAMLDVLEKAGYGGDLAPYVWFDEVGEDSIRREGYGYFSREETTLQLKTKQATRTATVARALIVAYQTGLLSAQDVKGGG